MTSTPWIAYRRDIRTAQMRLFCFAFAGGGASVFVPWIEALAPEIEVCPVQLPGRETRFSEPLMSDADAVADQAAKAIAPFCSERGGRYAFFGHSLGAILAYEVAQRLRAMGVPSPERLVVSARRGAMVPHNGKAAGQLPDAEFKARLLELKGTPREFIENPDLVELLLPRVRKDFLLDETYVPKPGYEPLDCPISAFGGSEDVDVPEADLRAWSGQTKAGFDMKIFEGGDHFFIQTRRAELLAAIARLL
jgi:surfactin synthase thioesterase subunit